MNYCDVCEKQFKRISNDHVNTVRHGAKLKRLQLNKTRQDQKDKLKECKIYELEMKNKKGEAVGVTLVDEIVYHHLIDINAKIYLSKKYAQMCIKINGVYKTFKLHRYIFYEFYKNKKHKDKVIDHRFNKLDNRIENLREFSHLNNSHNRLKLKNSTSQYYGVWNVNGKWRCHVNYENHKYKFIKMKI